MERAEPQRCGQGGQNKVREEMSKRQLDSRKARAERWPLSHHDKTSNDLAGRGSAERGEEWDLRPRLPVPDNWL